MAKIDFLEDQYGVEPYDPGLYTHTDLAQAVDGFDAVTDEDIAQFHDQGFLAIQNAYSQDQVAQAMDAVSCLIAGQMEDFKGVQFEKGVGDTVGQMDATKREVLVRKLTRFIGFDPRLDVLGQDERLLNVLNRMMGEPPRLFANQAMLKPPGIGREKPWHQDHAYFNLPLDTCIISAWVALDDATPENGCMHVIPKSQQDGPVVHFNRRDWQICDTDIAQDRIVAVPLEPGGV